MKANGAQGRRFPGVITSGYLPNNGLHPTPLSRPCIAARFGFVRHFELKDMARKPPRG
jgi:hypothetical protein